MNTHVGARVTTAPRKPIWPTLGPRLVLLLGSVILLTYVLGPIYWVFASSMMTESEIVSKPPHWLPAEPNIRNFRSIFFYSEEKVTYETRRATDPTAGSFVPSAAQNLVPALKNSMQVGVWVAALNIVFSLTAAYAIARIRFRGRSAALYSILATRVIPDIAIVVPLFLVMRNLDLVDTKLALIVSYLAITVPFTMYILINYFGVCSSSMQTQVDLS